MTKINLIILWCFKNNVLIILKIWSVEKTFEQTELSNIWVEGEEPFRYLGRNNSCTINSDGKAVNMVHCAQKQNNAALWSGVSVMVVTGGKFREKGEGGGDPIARNFWTIIRCLALTFKKIGNVEAEKQHHFYFIRITLLTWIEILLLALASIGIFTVLGQLLSYYKG